MYKYILSITLSILLNINLVFCQTNQFAIGIFEANSTMTHYGNGCETPYATATHNGFKSSVLNVLSEDGFNICSPYYPSEWTSEEYLKNFLKLADANGFKVELSAGDYYKPNLDINGNYTGSGNNVYDNCGHNISSCQSPYSQEYFRADVENLINNIYNINPYKEIIWGYHICEEASYEHPNHSDINCDGKIWGNPNYFTNVEIPPSNVSSAIDFYKTHTSPNHKVAIMEAHHHKNINDNTLDGQGIYNPQDYIQLMNLSDEREIILEGSYTQFPTSWYQQNYLDMYNNGFHYLGAFKSLDYESNYSKEVHKVINIEGTTIGSGYDYHYHSDLNTKNANWLWFQTYNSIIHGAKGIWFWSFGKSWNTGELNYFGTGIAKRYEREFFPLNYRNYISHLAKELKFLSTENLISSNSNTELYTKKDESDPNCIVPPASSYIPSSYAGINLSNHQNEFYGLRYTIRTNGDEVIMIITNPLNVPITTMLDFSHIGNPIIKNSTGVDVLFESQSSSHTSNSYKTDRNSTIDLNNSTVGKQYYKAYSSGKNLSLDFGPLDVHILKFRSTPPISYNNGWEKIWTNNGSGNLDGWEIRRIDKFYAGDFDGDGAEELFCVNNSNDWLALLDYENGDWKWKWSNYGSSNMILPYKNNLLVGDFDGDGRDELLGNDSWITMFYFENNTWNWGWSDYGNHAITSFKDKIIVGDFDGDNKDEALGCDLPNGWTTMFNFDNNNFQWGWSDYGGNHSIRPYRETLRSGDFDNDGKDEAIGLDSWATLFNFDNNDFIWSWSTYGSPNLGGWNYPLNVNDRLLIGNIDNFDTKDEIVLLQTGNSANSGLSIDLNSNQNGWNSNWTANSSLPYINDWTIGDNGGSNSNYLLVKAVANEPEYLLAFREYGCSSSNYNFLVSMYKTNTSNNYRLTNENSTNNNNQEEVKSDEAKVNNFKVFPNPSQGQLNINFTTYQSNTDAYIMVYNSTGQLIKDQKIETLRKGQNHINIDITNSPKGLYLVMLKYGNNKVFQEKVVITK